MTFRFLAFVTAITVCMSACAPHYGDDRFVRSAKQVRPSVVLLTMHVPPEHKGDAYDDAYATGMVIASGTWGSDILTVDHAVDDASSVVATIANRTRSKATILARDKALDIALLRIRLGELKPVVFGESRLLESQLGRDIALLGYPIPDEFRDEGLGLATSLNTGRLSSVRKGALEVTLPIVPGESGAPVYLVDSGRVIGVAESRFDDEHSIGFALPIDDARPFLHAHDAEHGF